MKKSRKAIAVNTVVPAILVVILSSGMALRQLERDTASTANIMINHIDHVTSIARNAALNTGKTDAKSCQNPLKKITEIGAFTPYIRSVGIIRDDILICSSITGSWQQTVSKIFRVSVSAPYGSLKINAIKGTSSEPGHVVIIYALGMSNHVTAFSVVDALYFTDLIDSLYNVNNQELQLQFSDGLIITGNKKNSRRTPFFRSAFDSNYSQARIQVITPLLSLSHYIIHNLLFLAPITFLLTLGGVYLRRRWNLRKTSLGDEINKGITEGEFSVHYQPICKTESGMCIGAEALMRWERFDGKTISPEIFIGEAEEKGMIIRLTQHLFRLIENDVKHWKINAPFHLGVNIAPSHLADSTFINDVLRLRRSLETSFCLVLEITERSIVEDTITASKKLSDLRQKGCKVAVDDFGTGYCSLNLLQSLPVDYLKIDKCFIDTLTSAGTDTPVLNTIIDLSNRMGFNTIAEGVSTTDQSNWLNDNNVPYAQGYLYSRPMTGNDFYQWYRKNSNKLSAMKVEKKK